MDTTVVCKKCGKRRKVSFGHCLGHGWPECCGQTMSLEKTTANIDKAVGSIVKEAIGNIKT